MKQKPSTYRDTLKPIGDRIDDAIVNAVFLMDNDDELDLDTILVSLAEARAYLIKAQLMAISADNIISIDVPNDQPRVYADQVNKPRGWAEPPAGYSQAMPEGAKPKPLPPIKPQGHEKIRYKPGISKMFKKAIEFDCPSCGAEAGTRCFKFEGPGAHPKVTEERNDGTFFHSKRQDLAKAYNDRIRKANILH